MFKCCLCGKEYIQSSAAVRCVNKCSREMFSNGAFKKKDSTYRGETTTTEFPEITIAGSPDLTNIDIDKIREEITNYLVELEDKNNLKTATLYTSIFSNWDNKTDEEKQADLNRTLMLKNLYSN